MLQDYTEKAANLIKIKWQRVTSNKIPLGYFDLEKEILLSGKIS